MRIFVVAAQPNENVDALTAAIAVQFPAELSRQLRQGVWLVAGDGSSDDIARRLGVLPDARVGGAVVVAMEGYAGYAPMNLWDWIKGRLAAPASGPSASSPSVPNV